MMHSELKNKALFSKISKIIPEIDTYLGKVISHAYARPILIANPVLSRNPFMSMLILKIARDDCCTDKRSTFLKLTKKLLRYYVKNAMSLVLYFATFLAFKVSRLRYRKSEIVEDQPVIIINTFTMIDKIYPKRRFVDEYFGDLYEIMNKRRKQYVVFCFLFGDSVLNIRRKIETYNILARDQRNFVTEFEIIGLAEWIEIARFILVYPLLSIALRKHKFGKFDRYLREEMVETLDTVHFHEYIRYLVGRRLGKLTRDKLKLICWWENQVIDKMLIRGVRDGKVNADIIGCQFFAKCPHWTNLYPLTDEAKCGTQPDVVLVSGEYYLCSNTNLYVRKGISPRYDYLFEFSLEQRDVINRNGFLLLLPYSVGDAKRIVRLFKEYQSLNHISSVTLKLHPNHVLRKPFSFPTEWNYTDDNLNAICPHASIVLTSESSAALEAAVMGCSVIIVGSEDGLTFNPMPEHGKGKIWDLVFELEELETSIGKLGRFRQENSERIIEMAYQFREMFFTRATEEKFLELFDL